MSLSLAKVSDSVSTLKGIGMPSERLPAYLKVKLKALSADICRLLQAQSFVIAPQDIEPHRVKVHFNYFQGSVVVSREKEVMSSSIFEQFEQRARAFLRRFQGRGLEETVQEFASTWEEARQYAQNVRERGSLPIVRANLGLVRKEPAGKWSTAVGYYAPRMAVIGDFASLCKNWIKAVIGSQAISALLLGYLGRVFGLISSSSNFETAFARKSYAMKIGDTDGAVQALSLQVSSATGFTLSSLGILSGVFSYCPAINAVIGKVFSVLIPFSTLLGLTRTVYKLEANQEVTQGLFNYTRNPQVEELAQLQGALKHLEQQLFVTEDEARGLSELEIAKLALRKKEVFQRTVGEGCVSLIYKSRIDLWIEQIQAGDKDATRIAQDLVDVVEKAMEYTQFKDQVYLAVSVASLIALAFVYLSTGGIPFTIWAINAAVNLLVDTGHLELLNSVVVPVVGALGLRDSVPELSRQRFSQRVAYEDRILM